MTKRNILTVDVYLKIMHIHDNVTGRRAVTVTNMASFQQCDVDYRRIFKDPASPTLANLTVCQK